MDATSPTPPDPQVLSGKLDRILAMRGDPKNGAGAAAFAEALADVDKELLLRAIIAATRELLLQDWIDRRKNDKRPQEALDAAEAWLASRSKEDTAKAKAAAKACTEARNETFGEDHRVPEAARHAAWAALGRDPAGLFDALETIEAELLARIALLSEYHRGPEMRRSVVAVLRRFLLPVEEKPAEAAPASKMLDIAVPYSPESHFELGQKIAHKKFGEITVTSVGETWIEVEIQGGEKKRLAHKPQPAS